MSRFLTLVMNLILLPAVLMLGLAELIFGPKAGCYVACHDWDHPGGHCKACGLCDEFFGPHDDCRTARCDPGNDA